MMKILRRLHLWLGCFFAPMLLFYVGTGWYQTLTLNRTKIPGEAEGLVAKFREVHVNQVFPAESVMGYRTWMYKTAVVLMSVALIVTVLLGLVMAFKLNRKKWTVWLALALGVAVPVLALWLGQRR
ncbi:MAG: hypothetical protein HY043_06270 [Verrucomicrobia bacterium]|nr:hypothetical protein [Verrucomicrobiota bacterium]